MGLLIQQWEPTAARRRVTFRLFTSNGTSPDTGALDDAVVLAVNSLTTISASSTCRAVNANNGMYALELSASETSVLGTLALYHTVGDFPQHVATANIVNFDPYGTLYGSSNSQIGANATTSNVSLGSGETTRDDWFNGATLILRYANGNVIANEISDYTGATCSASLKNALPLAPPSGTTYTIIPATYNDLSIQTVRGVANYSNFSGNLSNVTVRLADHDYSSRVTVGVGIATPSLVTVRLSAMDYSSVVTTGVGIAAPSVVTVRLSAMDYSSAVTTGVGIAAPSVVTVRLSAMDYSSVVTTGVGIIEGSAATRIADAVLDRNMATGTDSGTSAIRTTRDALRALRNRIASDATQLYIYAEDDTTIAWTASKATTASAVFLTGADPNS